MDTYDVAIIGGGPVGVGLAVELGQRGVRTALVERQTQPVRIPKGQNLTNRTLEHFYFWRCVDELRAARIMPAGYPIGGTTAYGNLMSPYWHSLAGGNAPAGRGPAVQDYFYQRNERLPQYCTEAVLRARLTQLPSVNTLFGWTAEHVEQDAAGANAVIAPSEEGAFYSWSSDTDQQLSREARSSERRQTIRASYIVGCDGGRSLVRESMGIDRGGRNFDQRMVLAVLRSRELHDALKRFPEGTTYRVLKPELQGFWQFFGRIDVGEGFFFHAPVPKDTRPDNYDFLALIRDAAGFDVHAEFDHVGFWDLRVMIASQYSKGRMFIAGDACHQHPPYGGFGLNTGLEDAVNLGWKLAAAVQGWGGQKLLESYGEERRPIFAETADVMIAGGIDRDREWLERYSPEKNREEFERAWAGYPGRGAGMGTSYEPHYEGSAIVTGPPGAVCGIHGSYSSAAQAGHHLTPKLLTSGRNVFEELGDGFTLLALDADPRPIEQAAKAANIPLKVIRDTCTGDREAYAAGFVLVRPDQYVAWAANESPADPLGLMC
ncbi:MAG TPA: FAD-dependent monooxygenase, partial [Chloroflexota bacterium]|nr:FAD-dependent monooxygenase [Chloroflexota bacterium]